MFADVHVNEKGKVTRVEITSARHPALGYAVRAALEDCEFAPFIKDGKPTPVILRREERFTTKPTDEEETAIYDAGGRSEWAYASVLALNMDLEKSTPVVSSEELDEPVKPIVRRTPLFPLSVDAQTEGEAAIEFVIDESGRVRAPRIISATNDAFGYSAVQALSTWGFVGPEKNNLPVCASTSITFKFTSKKITSSF